MSAKASWYQQGRVIYSIVEGAISMDDVEAVNQAITQYIREGQAPVHLIVDALRLDKFPLDLKRFSAATAYLREPNLGKIAVISKQSVFIRFFASVITQAARIEMQMFDTLEAGVDYLRRVDQTL